MKKYFSKIALVFLLATLFATSGGELFAQCPMCKMSAEQNLKDGGKAGRGLNTGILYIFVMPYLLVGTIGYWWYKNRKKEEPEAEDRFSDN